MHIVLYDYDVFGLVRLRFPYAIFPLKRLCSNTCQISGNVAVVIQPFTVCVPTLRSPLNTCRFRYKFSRLRRYPNNFYNSHIITTAINEQPGESMHLRTTTLPTLALNENWLHWFDKKKKTKNI